MTKRKLKRSALRALFHVLNEEEENVSISLGFDYFFLVSQTIMSKFPKCSHRDNKDT